MTLRYGLIGCGYVCQHHVDAIQALDGAKLVAVCDAQRDRAEQVAGKAGVGRVFADYRDLLALNEVDVVVNLLPTHLHRAVTAGAARQGKHVFVEKPIANTVAEAREMVRACREAGMKLCVGHSHRYFPTMQEARRIIAEGFLGDLNKIRVVNCSYTPTRGQALSWHWDPSISPGTLLDTGIHYVDDIRYLSGAEIEEVHALVRCSRPEDVRLPDDGVALMRLTNGATALWEVSDGQHTGKGKISRGEGIEVYGTRGSLTASLGGALTAFWVTPEGKEVIHEAKLSSSFPDIWRRLHGDFLKSILDDSPPPIPGEEGLRNLEALLAILEGGQRQ